MNASWSTLDPDRSKEARRHIDAALEAAGWVLQDRTEMNLSAASGVAVREFKMADRHGFADYMLFVDGKAVGVLEAKPAGYPLTSVELQADKYATGLPTGRGREWPRGYCQVEGFKADSTARYG